VSPILPSRPRFTVPDAQPVGLAGPDADGHASQLLPNLHRFTFLRGHVERMLGEVRLVRAARELWWDPRNPRRPGAADGRHNGDLAARQELLRRFFSTTAAASRVWWELGIESGGEGGFRESLTALLVTLVNGTGPFAVKVSGGPGSGKRTAAYKAFRDCVVPVEGGGPPLQGYVPLWLDHVVLKDASLPSQPSELRVAVVNRAAARDRPVPEGVVREWLSHPPWLLWFLDLPRQGMNEVNDVLAQDMIRAAKDAFDFCRERNLPHGFVLVCRGPKQEQKVEAQGFSDLRAYSVCRPGRHHARYFENYHRFRAEYLGVAPEVPHPLPGPALDLVRRTPELLHDAAVLGNQPGTAAVRSLAEIIGRLVQEALVRAHAGERDDHDLSDILFTRAAVRLVESGEQAIKDSRLKTLLRYPGEWNGRQDGSDGTFSHTEYFGRDAERLPRATADRLAGSLMERGEGAWRFIHPRFRDYFAAVHGLYWYKGPVFDRQRYSRSLNWAENAVFWLCRHAPHTAGAAELLAGMLSQSELWLLLEELLLWHKAKDLPEIVGLVQHVLRGRRGAWEQGESDALFRQLHRAVERYEPAAWPESVVSLVCNLVPGPDDGALAPRPARLERVKHERFWLQSHWPLDVPQTNSARAHGSAVVRLGRLSGNVTVSLGRGGSLTCWDPVSGAVRRLHLGRPRITAFWVAGFTIFAGCADGSILAIPTPDEEVPGGEGLGSTVLLHAPFAVRGLRTLAGGSVLVSAHADGTVLLCRRPAGQDPPVELLARLGEGPTDLIAFRDEAVVLGDRSGHLVLLWADGRHADTRAEAKPHADTRTEAKPRGAVRCLEPVGDQGFASGHDSGAVCFWQVDEGQTPVLRRVAWSRPERGALPNPVVRLLQVDADSVIAAHEDGALALHRRGEAVREVGRLRRAATGLAVEGDLLVAYDGAAPPCSIPLPLARAAPRETGSVLLLDPVYPRLEDYRGAMLVFGSREGIVADQLLRPADGAGGAASGQPPPPPRTAVRFGFPDRGGQVACLARGPGGDSLALFDHGLGPGRDRQWITFRQPITCHSLDGDALWVGTADGHVLRWGRTPREPESVVAVARGPVFALVRVDELLAVIDVTGQVRWLTATGARVEIDPFPLKKRPTAAVALGRTLILGDETGRVTAVTPCPGEERPGVQVTKGPVCSLAAVDPSAGLLTALGEGALGEGHAWVLRFRQGGFEICPQGLAPSEVSALGTVACLQRQRYRFVCGLADGGLRSGTIVHDPDGAPRVVADPGEAMPPRHKGPVTAIALREETAWATGGADGAVLLWTGTAGDAARVQSAFVTYDSVVALKWIPPRLFVGLRGNAGTHLLTEADGGSSLECD
jgi:hypothetical protein